MHNPVTKKEPAAAILFMELPEIATENASNFHKEL